MKKIYYSLLAALGLAGTAMAVSSTGGLTRAESDYDVVGTYELTVQKTDLYGDKDLYDPVKIEVEVRQNGDDYCIAEIGDTDLFKGYIVPFTYNPTNKYATFDPAYVSPLGDAYLWVSAFAFNGSFAEPQPSFGVIFTPEDGFSFPTDNEEGIAWYLSGSDSEFLPENMYNGFYIYGPSSSDDSGDNGGEESGQYANPAVEGNWTITLDGHYMGQYSSGEETFTYVATLEGNTVTFECQGYGDNIVAEFTAENTLTFKKAVIKGEEAVNGTYQVPYINKNGIEDLDELEADIVDSFSATYNPADGSLILPENCGFLYGIFNNTSGELVYWNDAFDLVSANQEVSGSDEPQPDYADESIVGDWNITLNGQYLDEYSLGQFTETFSASLDGNKVIFESTGSNYNIVAEFTAPGVLTFKKAAVGNAESTYGLNQVPYINNNDATDLEALQEDIVDSFEATYNSFNNTITFQENCGLLYGMFNNTTGVLSYYEDAYDFVSAVKVAKEVPNYANESIVGNWDFTLNGNYLGEYSLGQFTETFTASLEGNIVTFESSQSQYNIVAEFIGENMLKFNFCPVGPEATFTLYQSPFINSDESKNIDDLTEVSFVATYKEDTNSIVFPEMSGLRYGYFNAAGELSYWDDAFDFVSAVKSSKETPSFANESIVGNWDITLDGHYLGEYSIGQFTETFEASLEGNIVTFASTQSQFNIVAEFVAENTLRFNQCAVGPEAVYTLYQSPFINSDDTSDLESLVDMPFVATYDEEAGKIAFPEMSGLRYGYFDAAGNLSYWDDAFDFVAANKSTETPNYGNESIVGNWDITLDGHYLGEYSIGQFTETFEASLEGNIVTFASTQSQFNIVAEFVAENTLKFNQCAVGPEAVYTLYQSPFINSDDTSDLESLVEMPFVATYDEEAGKIVFPEMSGLRYGYFDPAGELSYWDDAFDFVAASKSVESEVVGQYQWYIQPTDITGDINGEVIGITVEVSKAGDVYSIAEVGGTTYFNGMTIPFSYNEETELAQFTAHYVGVMAGQPVWMSAFLYNDGVGAGPFIEPQENYGVTFTVDGGFEFIGNSGFGWFFTSSAEAFDPETVYSAFYVVPEDYSAIKGIDSTTDGETIYYDLQGHRVNNPQGGIFIMKNGKTVKKVMIKN